MNRRQLEGDSGIGGIDDPLDAPDGAPTNPMAHDRRVRHNDPLTQLLYDRIGAELVGWAQCLATMFEQLQVDGFERAEALSLVMQANEVYLDRQIPLSDDPSPRT